MGILLGRKSAALYLELNSPQKILDVACGTGAQAYEFSKLGHAVIGIDQNSKAIKQAEETYMGIPNLHFQTGDATSLPYSDNEFDITSVSFALHDMAQETQIKVIEEMKRVTKINGKLVIVEYIELGRTLRSRLIYPFLRSSESIHWSSFIKHDLNDLLTRVNLKVEKSKMVYGLLQILVIKNEVSI